MKIDQKSTKGAVVCSVINKKKAWKAQNVNQEIRSAKYLGKCSLRVPYEGLTFGQRFFNKIYLELF
tara:strand:+ start:173 stop:370 length:198 start_codon:yes stop_codon:yes gene_type:complete